VKCETHGTETSGGIPCAQCIAERTPIAVIEQSSESLDDDALSEADVYSKRGKTLWERAAMLLDADPVTAVKLSDAAVKWHRLDREIRGEVSQRRQLRAAIAHEKAMQGKRH
jgi:hypothetical protein